MYDEIDRLVEIIVGYESLVRQFEVEGDLQAAE
jgi:hypothetical protein